MSWTNNIIVSFSLSEFDKNGVCPAISKINRWLKKSGFDPLQNLFEACGSTRSLYGNGWGHFDMDAFVDVVHDQKWRHPECVQLFWWGEEDETFTTFGILYG